MVVIPDREDVTTGPRTVVAAVATARALIRVFGATKELMVVAMRALDTVIVEMDMEFMASPFCPPERMEITTILSADKY
jgi:hypothetical protein